MKFYDKNKDVHGNIIGAILPGTNNVEQKKEAKEDDALLFPYCTTERTSVPTTDSSKLISKLQVGDKVFLGSGAPVPVNVSGIHVCEADKTESDTIEPEVDPAIQQTTNTEFWERMENEARSIDEKGVK